MPFPARDVSDFLPTASLAVLRQRARVLKTVREFFDTRGYWEVQTPLLSHDAPLDSHLVPFTTEWWPGGIAPATGAPTFSANVLYLQTSPEFCMKRLLAAGADAIYQLGSVFRNGESGSSHNPEFTMLEWYRTGDTLNAQLQLVEDLVDSVYTELKKDRPGLQSPARPFLRTTYRQAFQRELGFDVFSQTTQNLVDAARERQLTPPPGLTDSDHDGWLNFLLALLVEPHLGRERPEFLCDYPASQAALARIRPGDPPVAERFELYDRGVELCNGYVELTEPRELSQRIAADSLRREQEGLPPLQSESRLLQAMQSGLPESVGVALGFDRLCMLALGLETIDEVIPFPLSRA